MGLNCLQLVTYVLLNAWKKEMPAETVTKKVNQEEIQQSLAEYLPPQGTTMQEPDVEGETFWGCTSSSSRHSLKTTRPRAKHVIELKAETVLLCTEKKKTKKRTRQRKMWRKEIKRGENDESEREKRH